MTIRNGFTCLSKHARLRLNERSNLLESQLINMLNTDSFINLGCEIGFYRQHCLLFSIIDGQYYVAVQDENSGKVITFLLLEYHLQLSWKLDKAYSTIDEEVLRRAQVLAKYSLTQADLPCKISLKIRYVDSEDILKIKVIKKFNADCWDYDPRKLIIQNQKITNLINYWKKKNNVKEFIDVFAYMGKKATPHFLEESVVAELNGY